jgi:hypothetical protein
MKKINFLCAILLWANVAFSQTNVFPTNGDAAIKTGQLLLETNTWRESLLTFKDTHYTPFQLYQFQLESDGLKLKQDATVNYQFKSGGDFIVNNGKLGVGTDTPIGKIDIRHAGGQLSLSGGSVVGGLWTSTTDIMYLADWNTGTRGLNINMSNGNVGVGISTPEGKLHVRGVAYFGNENQDSYHRIAVGGSGGNYGSVGYGYKYTNNSHEHIYSVADYASQLRFDIGGFNFLTAPNGSAGTQVPFASAMLIKQNGNVGIGTTNPNQKLTVNGTIYGKEVKVDLNVPGPDYVFEPTYNLPSLTEIETYIKANKHLPEVPSAKEMEADGINLSEMNMLLLRKIEELTLHLIDQNKLIDKLQFAHDSADASAKKMEELTLHIIRQEKRISELELKQK